LNQQSIALQVIESLRKGIPPQRGVDLYSIGNEKLIEGIKKYHFSAMNKGGIIRFVSGSWGAGKTHFFRQLRESAFQNGCLVSNVELDVNSAALNKFQSVFAAIIHQVSTPTFYYEENVLPEIVPFGTVIRESLSWLTTGNHEILNDISYEQFSKAAQILMSDHSIDIDFKKMIQKYWETFLPDAPDQVLVEQTRGDILQWFCGEGNLSIYRKRFDVSKIISKENAKLMLHSLAGFIRLSGYKGLLILFDEAEQAYSVMRKSALRDAHNNLLSLINNVEALPGLFLIYATTPDFYDDPKHGIAIYGALSGRIGKPDNHQPRALDIIWNLDTIEIKLEDYQEAAKKIRNIYTIAYPESESLLPDEKSLLKKVEELFHLHPSLAAVRFWRLLVTALVADFDDHLEGEPRSTEQLYDDVMDRLREE
jgi:hypothetical protein